MGYIVQFICSSADIRFRASEQMAVLRVLPPLFNALLNISLAHNWLSTSLLTIQIQASLVQALPPSASPLAQFPNLTPEQALELSVVNGVKGRQWADTVVKKSLLSGETADVAAHWPKLDITHAEFRGPSRIYRGLARDCDPRAHTGAKQAQDFNVHCSGQESRII